MKKKCWLISGIIALCIAAILVASHSFDEVEESILGDGVIKALHFCSDDNNKLGDFYTTVEFEFNNGEIITKELEYPTYFYSWNEDIDFTGDGKNEVIIEYIVGGNSFGEVPRYYIYDVSDGVKELDWESAAEKYYDGYYETEAVSFEDDKFGLLIHVIKKNGMCYESFRFILGYDDGIWNVKDYSDSFKIVGLSNSVAPYFGSYDIHSTEEIDEEVKKIDSVWNENQKAIDNNTFFELPKNDVKVYCDEYAYVEKVIEVPPNTVFEDKFTRTYQIFSDHYISYACYESQDEKFYFYFYDGAYLMRWVQEKEDGEKIVHDEEIYNLDYVNMGQKVYEDFIIVESYIYNQCANE